MKKLYFIFFQVLFCISFMPCKAAWNGDILVHAGLPSANHSMSAKANGTLFICVPVDSGNGVYAIATYLSTDNGDTWTTVLHPAAVTGWPILKTKMVTTGTDSVYCLYLTAASLHILNVESGIVGQFNTTAADNFDAAPSPNGNAIYLFVNEPGNFDIRRYGTLDGGLSWTGNTALVTGNGYAPKVYMTGTRLILNYYGPVAADTTSSVIRAAFYDESVPGTITPGTFQDVVTSTLVKKKEFMSVIYNLHLWLFYTEGDLQQVLKCRVSTDGGSTYGPEFTVGGNATANAYKFDAKHYTDATGGGCYLAYFSDSILFPPPFDPMVITNATILTPTVFSLPIAFNDFTITTTPSYTFPVVVPFINGTLTDAGVAWVEQDVAESVYFDRLSNVTELNEQNNGETSFFSVLPNPANGQVRFAFNVLQNGNATIIIYDAAGKIAARPVSKNLAPGTYALDAAIGNLDPGLYFVRYNAGDASVFSKLVIY